MGTQALCHRGTDCWRVAAGRSQSHLARPPRLRLALTMTCLTLVQVLAGCSSFSSPSSSASTIPPNPSQTAASPPGMAGAPIAATSGPAAADPYGSPYPYPKQSLVDVFRDSTDSQAPAQIVPRPPSTYTPSAQPYYTGQPPAYGTVAGNTAPPGAAPPQAAALPPGAPPPGAPPPPANSQQGNVGPYPSQSLFDVFSK